MAKKHQKLESIERKFTKRSVDMLPKRAKEYVTAKLSGLKTGFEAQSLAANKENFWSYKTFDEHGRIGVLSFNGVEQAIFYQRQLTSWKQEDIDPVPEKDVTDNKTEWVRLDFINAKGTLAKNSWFADREKELLNEAANHKALSTQMALENDQLKAKLDQANTRITTLKASKPKGKKR